MAIYSQAVSDSAGFPLFNMAIEKAGLHTLYNRRESLTYKLFNDIVSDKDHKLAELLPPRTNSTTARHDYVKGELLKFHAYVQTALKTHLSCITRRTIVNSLLFLNGYVKI